MSCMGLNLKLLFLFFGVAKGAGHELSQKIATLYTHFQLRQTTMGLSCFFVFFVCLVKGSGPETVMNCDHELRQIIGTFPT